MSYTSNRKMFYIVHCEEKPKRPICHSRIGTVYQGVSKAEFEKKSKEEDPNLCLRCKNSLRTREYGE